MSESTVQSTKKSFFSSVAVLALSSVAVKIIGAFYKLPLVGIIGIDGMAYFLAAYHIYTLLFTVSTAGLPVAVSILVSKKRAVGDLAGAENAYSTTFRLFTSAGLLLCALTYICADAIAAAVKIPGAAHCLRAIAPALVFSAMQGALRGYFQGCGEMRQTAVSQIIESACKLILGLVFTFIALKSGYTGEIVSAAAIFGITVGSALAAVYLLVSKSKKRTASVYRCKSKGVARELLRISAPITLGATVISLSGVVDTALIPSRLQAAGLDEAYANAMYSGYGNLAVPLFNLVPSFITPIAVAMAPLIAEASAKGDSARERGVLLSAFKLCWMIATPASLGLAVFSRPILELLYPAQVNAVGNIAPLLSVLSPAVVFSCMISVTNAALQAYGRERLPVISMLLGICVKIVLEYFLLSIPQINIMAAPVSTLVCDLLVAAVNLGLLEKYSCGLHGFAPGFLRPLSAALLSTGVAVCVALALREHAPVMLAALADVLIYPLLASKCGALTEDEFALLPNGEKIIKIMKKLRLLRNYNEQRGKNSLVKGQKAV